MRSKEDEWIHFPILLALVQSFLLLFELQICLEFFHSFLVIVVCALQIVLCLGSVSALPIEILSQLTC